MARALDTTSSAAHSVEGVGPREHRLSLERIEEAARQIDPVFRDTPQYICEPLSEQLGCSLLLKVETLNPIRSFKGRGASHFVSRLEPGSLKSALVCASAGNFGQAMAYACRRRKIPLIVYAARGANPLKLERMRALGAEVRLAGDDFDEAKEAARSWAETQGAQLVVDGLEPAIAEGAGTIGRELLSSGERFDAIVVPLGNGALLTGVARWVKAHAPTTRMIGVCSSGAPAMRDAFRQVGAPNVQTSQPRTIADGIAVRVAIPEALVDMAGLVDDVVLVDDREILSAMQLLHRHAGLVVEPAGAAGVAAILSDSSSFRGSSIATVLCGGNVTSDQMNAWLQPADLSTGSHLKEKHDD